MSGTTTNYGWTYPTSTDYVKDGATAIQTAISGADTTLGTALNNKLHAGLVFVKSQSVGTGVSSVIVTSAFNSTYENYKVVYTGGTMSTSDYFHLQFRTGASTSATGYYYSAVSANYAGSGSYTGGGNQTWARIGYGGTSNIQVELEIFKPFLTAQTNFSSRSIWNDASGFSLNFNNWHNQATSYDQIVLTPGVGTLTGGTISVYGYAKD